MTTTDILKNLQSDAKSLHPADTPSVNYYLSVFSSESQIEDRLLRHVSLLKTYYNFHDYCQTHDWIRELGGGKIDVDMVSMLSIPAQLYQQNSKGNLTENCYFLAGLRLLLTVMLYDNALERAFAAESIVNWLQAFRDYLDEFYEEATPVAVEVACHCKTLPQDISSHCFGKLFGLELIRIQSTFSSEFPQYEMYDPNELDRHISAIFEGKDPGYDLSNAVARRLLKTVTFFLYTFSDEVTADEIAPEDEEKDV